jgi:phosphatidate cytidylyltransferase
MASNMVRRVAVAAVAIPAALGLVRLGGWPLAAALGAFAGLGTAELFRIAGARGIRAFTVPGVAAAAAVPLVLFGLLRGVVPPLWAAFGAVAWLITVMAAAVLRRPPDAGPLGAVAVTAVAPVYTGLIGFVLAFRHGAVTDPWAATWLVFLPLVSVWICDSAAMQVGSMVGGPKFAPVVSPNKTWSGTIAGSLAATMVAPLFTVLFLRPAGVDLPLGAAAVFGFVVASLGQIGDLAESLFKREAGVKDSGTFFPGHGGVLDRLDSLYWALPTGAALLTAFGIL